MKEIFTLIVHFFVTLVKLSKLGGVKVVMAENNLLKQQLLVFSRKQKRAPKITPLDRFFLGYFSLFLSPRRLLRAAIIIKPSTLLRYFPVASCGMSRNSPTTIH
jgi:putative transposase